MESMLSQPQEWLLRRFQGLRPIHFEQASSEVSSAAGMILISCNPDLEPPQAFRRAWCSFRGRGHRALGLTRERLASRAAVLVLSNPFDPEQRTLTSELVATLNAFGPDAPPIFWIPHTVVPEVRPPEHKIHSLADPMLRIVNQGLDGILPDEHEGMKLALHVRMMIQKSEQSSKTLNTIITGRRVRSAEGSRLQDQIHNLLWVFVARRTAPAIPPCNFDLPQDEPREIAGKSVGAKLAKGAFGSIFALEPHGPAGGKREAVKVLKKSKMGKVRGIHEVNRMLTAMRLADTPEWRHPNLAKLYDIFHTKTYISVRMEHIGSESLFQRLRARDDAATDGKKRPMSMQAACCVIGQVFSVVSHLNFGPGICHRDLKPENFGITETPATVLLKLHGFDFAVALSPQPATCKNCRGTVPFVAPEVLAGAEYDGLAADAWSLGVVLLEILTSVRVFEGALGLKRSSEPDGRLGRTIASWVSHPKRLADLLRAKCQEDMRPLQQSFWPVVRGSLCADVPLRWPSSCAYSHVEGVLLGQKTRDVVGEA